MSLVLFTQAQDNKTAYKFFEFEKISRKLLKEKFEEFHKKLKEDSISQGYIITYGTTKEIAKREKQIRNLINFRDLDSSRFTFVQGGNNGKLKTVFWIVPNGAEPPTF